MGQSKQLWIAECERIVESYADRAITRDEAVKELMSKGYDDIDAENLIDSVDERDATP